jgi:hypothetical protein
MGYRFNLAFVCRSLGRTEERAGHPAEALAAFDRARQFDATEAPRIFIARYNDACDLALMVRAAPTDRGASLAAKAIQTLRKAIAQGFRNYVEVQNDPDFSSLRDRRDLNLILLDIAFPADPFGQDSGGDR